MRTLPSLLIVGTLALAGTAQGQSPEHANLRCQATAVKPRLDFEFRFVAGLLFTLPVKQFWEQDVDLKVIIEVEPIGGSPGETVRFSDRRRAPQVIPTGSKGELFFSGVISLGVGRYLSRWRIESDDGRACQGSKKFDAKLSRAERGIEVTLAPGEIKNPSLYVFREDDPIERPHLGVPQRLKIFVSLDVLGRRGRVVRPRMGHIMTLAATMRQLGRSQSFNEFSVVVFSFEDQKIVSRQDYGPTIDFTPLRGVIQQLQPDTVDINELMGGEIRFFFDMLAEEMPLGDSPDGVVFIGHEMFFGFRVPGQVSAPYRSLGIPVAFFDGSRLAWNGLMGSLVRGMDGREYALRNPSDLAKAVSRFEDRVQVLRPQ